MIIFRHSDEEEELEAPEDEEAALADDLLDEVGDDAVGVADDMEGFGLLTEEDVSEEEEKEKEDEDEDEATLDEDAEDVDFDTFDDIDEM
jgi:hypothetical protein